MKKKGTFGPGNPGRPKGAKNKVNVELGEKISEFLNGNFEKVRKDFVKLKPRDRLKFYTELLQYGVPKLQATSLDLDLDRLTDEQLDIIINDLKKSINGTT